MPSDSQAIALFEAFDSSGDGYLQLAELQAALAKGGKEVSEDDCRAILNDIDADADGKISVEEFKVVFAKAPDSLVRVHLGTPSRGRALRLTFDRCVTAAGGRQAAGGREQPVPGLAHVGREPRHSRRQQHLWHLRRRPDDPALQPHPRVRPHSKPPAFEGR
jgi:hypothetical protein